MRYENLSNLHEEILLLKDCAKLVDIPYNDSIEISKMAQIIANKAKFLNREDIIEILQFNSLIF